MPLFEFKISIFELPLSARTCANSFSESKLSPFSEICHNRDIFWDARSSVYNSEKSLLFKQRTVFQGPLGHFLPEFWYAQLNMKLEHGSHFDYFLHSISILWSFFSMQKLAWLFLDKVSSSLSIFASLPLYMKATTLIPKTQIYGTKIFKISEMSQIPFN